MKSHFNNLIFYIPDLKQRRILDLGCGKGGFLVEAALNGAVASGLEKSRTYIDLALKKADENKCHITVKEGLAENIPYDENSFDFVNMSEVIEHVEDPQKVLQELRRILSVGGQAYLSAPNRFSLRDTHFHLYFVNWLPRIFSDFFIGVFGKHKDYRDASAGRQRLKEMHYYTFGQINKILKSLDFIVLDMREEKIRRKFKKSYLKFISLCVYRFLRFFYFDTFHILVTKR